MEELILLPPPRMPVQSHSFKAPACRNAECVQVLATAVSSLDTICSATVDFDGTFDGNTGDESPPDEVSCSVNGSTASATLILNGVVTEMLEDFACEDLSEMEAIETATVCLPIATQ